MRTGFSLLTHIPLSSTRMPTLDLEQKSKEGGPITGRMLIRPMEILSIHSAEAEMEVS